MECKAIQLSEVITDIAAGPFGSNLKVSCFVNEGFPVIDGANLKGFKVTDNITKFVTEEKARSLHRSIAKRGDIIVTISGTLGQIAYIPDDSKYEEYLCSQRQFRVTFDTTKVYVPYLVFYFHTYEGQHKILSFANQVGVPALSQPLKNFRQITIQLPDLDTQKKIAIIVELINGKIEQNESINNNLEQQLHLLFIQIFNGISEDVVLGDVVETTSGGTPSRKHTEYYENSSICWVKSKELLGNYILDTEEHINDMALSKSSAKLLPMHSVLIAMYGATVGAYGIISKSMTCNQAVCALLCNEKYPYTYLFQIAQEQQQKLINMAVGSAQQNISQVLIKQLPLHSDIAAIRKFHNLALPLHKQIEKLQAENRTLSEMRDTLLPQLMSGELDVSNIDL